MTRSVDALLYLIRPVPGGFFVVSLYELYEGVTSPKGALGEPCESVEEARLFIPAAAEVVIQDQGDTDDIFEVWGLRLVPRGTSSS